MRAEDTGLKTFTTAISKKKKTAWLPVKYGGGWVADKSGTGAEWAFACATTLSTNFI